MSGKGDTPRPVSVDAATYSDNWARTFGQATQRTVPMPCQHNRVNMDMYESRPAWYCARCGQLIPT